MSGEQHPGTRHDEPAPGSRGPRTAGDLLGVLVRTLLAVVLGAVLGALGTVTHLTTWLGLPAGLVLALALTASTAVLTRAWAGYGTLLAGAVGWLVAVQALSVQGPGGDVLVPATVPGLVWTYGGLVVWGVAAFLPRRWFAARR
ncbi:DUF6113 family protein [Puerhibacterium puerhi]|uniref:DUF6113 family protein n=1 Tax=Puerhibacterium puerhi TaxID=2692623 RepID=UPI001F2B21F1|nr:DUF6113 family protein [Puerhibacterium puerhi]